MVELRGKKSKSEVHAIVLQNSGEPFGTMQAAAFAQKQKGLLASHNITPWGSGFALVPVGQNVAGLPAAAQPQTVSTGENKVPMPVKEKFWRVKFQPRSDRSQTADVVLAVNGDVLLLTRDEEVVIPERFREAADHAVTEIYRMEPGHDRKVVGTIKTYPYDVLGEGTEQEYMNQRVSGTAAYRAAYDLADKK